MEENSNNLEVILQDCLKKIRSGEDTLDSALARYPQIATELRPLLEAALWIQSRQGALQPRPGFVSASRHRLVEQIQKEQMALPASEKVSWWENLIQTLLAGFQQRHRAVQFGAILMLVLALLLSAGGTGIARASQDALPGELLYSVKRTIEKAELALTADEAGKAELYIKNARSRLEEVQSLIEENRTDHLDEAVLLFEDHVYNAVSIMVAVGEKDDSRASELAEELNSTLQEKSGVLRGLATIASPQINQDIDRLLAVSDGMVVLLADRFSVVEATPTPSPSITTTPEMAVIVPSATTPVPVPSETPIRRSKPVTVSPALFEPTATFTSTLAITSTVTISPDEDNTPPQAQNDKEKEEKEKKEKKEKKPKPEKTKKTPPGKPD